MHCVLSDLHLIETEYRQVFGGNPVAEKFRHDAKRDFRWWRFKM